MATASRIPLRASDGSIKAWTLVDPEDFEQFGHLRFHLTNRGYVARWTQTDGRRELLMLHRLILGLERGDRRLGDHINRDRLDNRRGNLRIVDARLNAQNRTCTGGSSRHRGVAFDSRKQRWMAYARVNGQLHHLGQYATELEAADVSRAFRLVHMPGAVEVAA